MMLRDDNLSTRLNRKISRAIDDEHQRLLKASERLIAQQPAPAATDKLKDTNPELGHLFRPFGLRIGSAQTYMPVPADTTRQRHNDWGGLYWRVELHGLAGSGPVGFDILGDVVLGRGEDPSCTPDIDLDPFGALEKGVSRRHAMLRPTQHALHLLDLDSTNGIRYNMLPVGPGIAHSIINNDTISLGNLTFDVRIIDGPGLWETQPSHPAIRA